MLLPGRLNELGDYSHYATTIETQRANPHNIEDPTAIDALLTASRGFLVCRFDNYSETM